jgi:hypothetical protein
VTHWCVFFFFSWFNHQRVFVTRWCVFFSLFSPGSTTNESSRLVGVFLSFFLQLFQPPTSLRDSLVSFFLFFSFFNYSTTNESSRLVGVFFYFIFIMPSLLRGPNDFVVWAPCEPFLYFILLTIIYYRLHMMTTRTINNTSSIRGSRCATRLEPAWYVFFCSLFYIAIYNRL